MPGGFTGVDIFFIISGFVVARSVRRLPAETFWSFTGTFYRRRMLRIFPAVTFFVLLMLLFCSMFLPFAPETQHLDRTGLLSLFAVSNFALMLQTGSYFQSASTFHPFMHTWSLGVEEQYYFIFPIFSFIILSQHNFTKKLRENALKAVVACVVLSLIFCVILTKMYEKIAFFMLPPRFWELGLGFLLYIAVDHIEHMQNTRLLQKIRDYHWTIALLSFAGMIITLLFANEVHFPYPWALLPCVSTMGLIVVMTLCEDSAFVRGFTWRPVLWVGTLSYSLYLWHWGVITAMRWTCGVDTIGLRLLAVVITFALSAFSYYCIEKPVRYHQSFRKMSLRHFYAGFAACFVVAAGIGGGLIVVKPALSLSVTRDTQRWLSDDHPVTSCPAGIQTTRYNHGRLKTITPGNCVTHHKKQIFILGDSHAGAYYRMAYRLAAEAGYKTYLFTLAGCASVGIIDHLNSHIAECPTFNQIAMSAIIAHAKPGDVLLLPALQAFRFRNYYDEPIQKILPEQENIQPQDKALAIANAKYLAPLAKAGLQIYIEQPKPLMTSALFRCADWYDRHNSYCSEGFPVTRKMMQRRNLRSLNYLKTVVAHLPGSRLWNTFDTLCPGKVCSGYLNGKPVIADTDHLSAYGNDLVYANLMQRLHADK